MAEIKIEDLTIHYSKSNLAIIDSYKIHDKRKMKNTLIMLLEVIPLYHTKRSIHSLMNEWIAHNLLYELNICTRHTKDCDFESKQKIYMFILYFILSMFSKIRGGFKKVWRKIKIAIMTKRK